MHDSHSEDGCVFISLGVCAMAKKTKSKPMKEILRRLVKFQHIRVIVFEERVILQQPIEAWPVCDALISFYSDGFPLQKAIAYSKLRRPYLVNDLEAQYVLMNRKKVYECLQSEGVTVPRYACVERGDPEHPVNVVEHDDAIEVDGEIFHKPFVEKPLNAEDHNIYIYFPSSAGGGSQRLFRKVGDRSSKYFQISSTRTEGSYLYEEFMPTDGTDVKVYTVADDYAHAEARKSPALDGKVERDNEGKEIRYPVILTPREKIIAKKVAKVVKQQICGFDLLRANGMSYVCDVNGFSFVKTSRKYYDDCSHVLGVLITRVIAPRLCPTGVGPWITPGTDDDIPLVPTTCGTIMELRCVIAVFRHGDRTPKQKMKMEVRDERFFQLFNKYAGGRTLELKLKKPTQLQEVLDIVRGILEDVESGKLKNSELEEKKTKFEQLRYVLEMYGSFSGINRKIQLKYQPKGIKKKKNSGKGTVDDISSVSLTDKLSRSRSKSGRTPPDNRSASAVTPTLTQEDGDEFDHIPHVEGSSGTTTATTGGAKEPSDAAGEDPCILLVVKWGGELTAAGRQQAEELGRAFRCIYPGGDGNYGKNPGLGLLRLHSTYRHDLKIYASDEGRVQMTAAAFAKGFLALEGELPPILVQMVKSANTNGLLDNDNDCNQYQQLVKKRIKAVMSYKGEWSEEHRKSLAPTRARSLLNAMDFVSNPTEACTKLFGYVQRLANRVAMMTANPRERTKVALYHNESWDLLLRRWGKLVKDFRSSNGDYDVSKLPDIYDNIKYDIQHNSGILIESEMLDFFSLARALADIVVPQEYGITREEKLVISQRICTPLLRKILSDARYTDVDECTRLHAGYSKGVASPERFVRTRLYFTSESHLHSILTCLQHGGLADAETDEQWKRAMDYVSTVPELNYLSQVVIMIYEDPTVKPKTEKKFHVELHFSPGAHALCRDLPAGSGFRPGRRENGWSETSLLSSSTSLAEGVLDSASELTLSSPATTPRLQERNAPSQTATSKCDQGTPTPINTRRCFAACKRLCLDRSLPADLNEFGQKPGSPDPILSPQPPVKRSSKKYSMHSYGSRHTSALYRPPPKNQSGLCYADIVNQDALLSHGSRIHELWLNNTRNRHRQFKCLKKGSERSLSTGPMVEHVSASRSVPSNKTPTRTSKAIQRALSSNEDDTQRPTSANVSQTRGRFTVTSPSSNLPHRAAPKSELPSLQRHSWYTCSVDVEDDDIETTGEPELSTSHSTLDFDSMAPPSSNASARHISTTTPGSPIKWEGRNNGVLCGTSPTYPVNTAILRRLSFGDQPQEFCTLQSKSSVLGLEEPSATTQVHTSLDSVKPDRAQELLDQGPPVAQWLMEYFDQIEKAKWNKGGESSSDSKLATVKQADYNPILCAVDYLTAGLCTIPNSLQNHAVRRGSADHIMSLCEDGNLSTTETCQAHMKSSPEDLHSPKPHDISPGSVILSRGSTNATSTEASDNPSPTDIARLAMLELNALTYPNYQMHIDLKELQKCPLGNEFCDLRSVCPTRRVRGLISTAVIRGSRDISSSVPDLLQLLNHSDSQSQSHVDPSLEMSDLIVPSAPSVPEIYPLETLHNAMTLCQLEAFFARLTTTKFPSPFTSPHLSSARVSLTPTERMGNAMSEHGGVNSKVYRVNASTPTTPTTISSIVYVTASAANDHNITAFNFENEPNQTVTNKVSQAWHAALRGQKRSISEPATSHRGSIDPGNGNISGRKDGYQETSLSSSKAVSTDD